MDNEMLKRVQIKQANIHLANLIHSQQLICGGQTVLDLSVARLGIFLIQIATRIIIQ